MSYIPSPTALNHINHFCLTQWLPEGGVRGQILQGAASSFLSSCLPHFGAFRKPRGLPCSLKALHGRQKSAAQGP